MTRRQFRITGSSLILLLTLLCTGCARSPAITYYQLVSLDTEPTDHSSSETVKAVLGLGPVQLPQYLDQPKLVNRISANRLQLADSHRWVEPLGENIIEVMEEELSTLLHPRQVVIFPWPRSQTIDCQLVVEVLHFETENDGVARLLVNWMVKDRDGNLMMPEQQGSYRVTASSDSHAARVRSLNEALEQFCREIAGELRPLLKKTDGTSS